MDAGLASLKSTQSMPIVSYDGGRTIPVRRQHSRTEAVALKKSCTNGIGEVIDEILTSEAKVAHR